MLEHKIGALDQAAPLVGWDLPEEFATLRRLIEARMAKRGKRECVQILRLLEVFHPDDVLAGVREAIARGAIGFDAVKYLVLCRIERRPPRLDLTVYPYLPRARVATTAAKAYLDLLAGARSVRVRPGAALRRRRSAEAPGPSPLPAGSVPPSWRRRAGGFPPVRRAPEAALPYAVGRHKWRTASAELGRENRCLAGYVENRRTNLLLREQLDWKAHSTRQWTR
jgi:hypothetical protein